MLKALIKAMNEAARNGLRTESGFKEAAWNSAVDWVNKATPNIYQHRLINAGACKSKLRSLETDWRMWKELCTSPGWSRDNFGRPYAEPAVMDAYFEAHKGALKFRKATLKYEAELDELFADATATRGEYAIGQAATERLFDRKPAKRTRPQAKAVEDPISSEENESVIRNTATRGDAPRLKKRRQYDSDEQLAHVQAALISQLEVVIKALNNNIRGNIRRLAAREPPISVVVKLLFTEKFAEFTEMERFEIAKKLQEDSLLELFPDLPFKGQIAFARDIITKLRAN